VLTRGHEFCPSADTATENTSAAAAIETEKD